MKYIDDGGDVWEDDGDGMVRVIEVSGDRVDDSEYSALEVVEELHGPLTPLTDGAERPSDGFSTVADVLDRASVFQSAHALLKGLDWGEDEKASVYDVLSVAKWLEGEG
ncbi:hypothetical protein M2271_003564 [Streptomyces sp. LBL]|uniref:hypothetical protein n=1 Tax=Streptomyces sp. LBL TaxID=2940562 RepID=UPI0024752A8A|nr:hypothetical protein [Streptomyces sp. LBL]MDH6625753.1 hypothetical protein [Streptomyces sp. LBL]